MLVIKKSDGETRNSARVLVSNKNNTYLVDTLLHEVLEPVHALLVVRLAARKALYERLHHIGVLLVGLLALRIEKTALLADRAVDGHGHAAVGVPAQLLAALAFAHRFWLAHG